jgi:TonB family protein
MSDAQELSSSIIIVSNDLELVEAITNSNSGDFSVARHESVQAVIEPAEQFSNTGIIIFDLDTSEGNSTRAINDILALKQANPTRVLILVGEHSALAEVLRANIQSLIYRAFNKPISPSQLSLAFGSAHKIHLDLVARLAAGEDLLTVGPVENKVSISNLNPSPQRNTAVFVVCAVAVFVIAGLFFFTRTDSDATPQSKIPSSNLGIVDDKHGQEQSDKQASISEINRLNQLASIALLDSRLISPKSDNALFYYNRVLALDPYDVSAYNGKRLLTKKLRDAFDNTLADNDYEQAFRIVSALQSIEPLNRRNDTLKQQLEQSLSQAKKEQVASTKAKSQIASLEGKLKRSESINAALEREKKLLADIDLALTKNNIQPITKGNAYTLLTKARKENLVSQANLAPRIEALSSKLLNVAKTNLNENRLERATQLSILIKNLDNDSNDYKQLKDGIDAAKEAVRLAAIETQAEIAEKATPVPDKVIPAQIISQAAPRYPNRALESGLEGWVELAFVVGVDGKPARIRVINKSEGGGIFINSALRAVKRWRFTPSRNQRTGQLLESDIDSTKVKFRIKS